MVEASGLDPRKQNEDDDFDEDDWNLYGALPKLPKLPKRKRSAPQSPQSSDSSSSSDSDSSGSSSSGSDSSDSDSSPSRKQKRSAKSSMSARAAVRAARQHATRVRAKLQGDAKGKPILLRTDALMRFEQPLKGLMRAAERADLSSCRKSARRLAQLLEAQAKDLLIAAQFGWDAVGALDDSSGPFSAKELKLIRQQLQVAKATRQASEGKGSSARRPSGPPALAHQPQQHPPQQRFPGFRPNAGFPDYRPPHN